MKKLLITTLILGTVSLNAQFYSEIKTGAVINQKADIAYKTGFQGTLECGYKYNTWRTGFELLFNQYRPNPQKIEANVADGPGPDDGIYNIYTYINDGTRHIYKPCHFRNIAAMCNVYYDYTINDKWAAYIGCGLGVFHMKYRYTYKESRELLPGEEEKPTKTYQFSKTFLAAQFLLGVSYSINEHWQISMGYRCLKAENGFMPRANKKNILIDRDKGIPRIKSIETPFMHTLECGLRYSF